MKILSMTATFGKLENSTLRLEPGMNIIEAPNEWGKSTWCAFLEAMLYGIDTSSRSKTGYLADKEHYAPWSGAPMSGSMDILWNEKEITVQRKSKGRIPFGEVHAFETRSGLPIPELSVNNCGELLLGVERSVFLRSGFLKQSQMPVTEDEKLRRRLNELVTTGDESGQSDLLEQKLKDLKNRCKFNKKGRIPELETQLSETEQKLQQLEDLTAQMKAIEDRQGVLAEENRLLENHLAALSYQENLQQREKLAAAQIAKEQAARELEDAQSACADLKPLSQLQQELELLEQLRSTREALTVQAQTLPAPPEMPFVSELFRGKDPETALSDARHDVKVLSQLQTDKSRPVPVILGSVLCLAGLLGALLASELLVKAAAAAVLICGASLLLCGILKNRKLRQQILALQQKYPGLPADRWVSEASEYHQRRSQYAQSLQQHQQMLTALHSRQADNENALNALTGGLTAARFEQECRQQQDRLREFTDARRKLEQAQTLLQALCGAAKDLPAPTFPDTLTLDAPKTRQQLSENQAEAFSLRQKLGQCQGQMAQLGQTDALKAQKAAMLRRKEALQQHYRALELALTTLDAASRELQRRFAPRISQAAQELFCRMTNGRYQRLALCRDLSLEAAAEGENTLRGSLWRSEGTVDQLYLALRLAVARELTGDAPLILDDALVRFDDTRLKAALQLLKETASQKQVILFTCQGREAAIMKEESL